MYLTTVELVMDRYGGKWHRPTCSYAAHIVGSAYEHRVASGTVLVESDPPAYCRRCCKTEPYLEPPDAGDDDFGFARTERYLGRLGEAYLDRLRELDRAEDDDAEADVA